MLLWKDNFEGASGAAWSPRWITEATGTGASTTIQSNQGSFNIGSVAGGVCAGTTVDKMPADFDLRMDYKFMGSSDIGYGFDVRYYDSNNLYFLEGSISGGGYAFYSNVAVVQTKISSDISLSPAANDVVHWRVQIIGRHFKIKHWLNSAIEPSTWNIDLIDSSVYCAGVVITYVYDNFGATGDVLHLDSVSLEDFKATPTPRLRRIYRG